MSVPPSTPPPNTPPPGGPPPPSGYPSYVPTPPRTAASGNGWKIFGVGCLALFLLAAIGGVVLVRNFKGALTHPDRGTALGVGILVARASLDGARLRQAIVAYHAENGRYPRSLVDLVAEGRIDGKLLHNDLADSPNPGRPSWRYVPPAEGAPGATPILREPYRITVRGQSAPGEIVITLDGKSQAGNATAPPPAP